jgi:hypothetical protein
LVNFSGKAADAQGKAISGVAGVTFAIYKDQYEGVPLWLETQNIQADPKGNYTIQLGATKPDGLPLDLFNSGEARWLGVRVNGGEEQARVVLLSVPYALKAADAETIGGLPPSAFVLTSKAPGTASTKPASAASTTTSKNAPANPAVTGKGTLDFIPMWDSTSDIINSLIFQKNSQIGIATIAPAATLDVNGKGDVRDTLTLFPKGTDPALAINGTTFKVDQTGKVSFVSGQSFPGAGSVASVALSAPSSDFTVSGSPVTKTGTLGLNWNVAPTSANTANAIVKRDGTGNFSGGAIVGNLGVAGFTALTCGSCAGVSGVNTSTGIGVYATGGTGIFGTGSTGGSFTGSAVGSTSVNSADAGGYGAFGYGSGSTTGTTGVVGASASGIGTGVWGSVGPISVAEQGINHFQPTGVEGDSGSLGGIGVLGTGDAGYGIVGWTGGEFAYPTAYFHQDASPTQFAPILQTYSSVYGGICTIDANANLSCTGSKSAVVPVDAGSRKVALYAIEGPENWFEDLGGSQLVRGAATVHLEPTFAQTVNTGGDYRVFLTPNGDCKGLYVAHKTASSFEVRELSGGTSAISFDYRIIAKRKGYENIRMADKTKEFEVPKLALRRPVSARASVKPAPPILPGVPITSLTTR